MNPGALEPLPANSLALIDAIGPFFRGYESSRINWSKIPFDHLELTEPGRALQWESIRDEMEQFCTRISAIGYNAISLDDLPHLAAHPEYEPEVSSKIEIWREEFRRLFSIARAHGLRIFITTDYLTASPKIHERIGNRAALAEAWFCQLLDGFLNDFPEVEGVILRIGESDGKDVKDLLRSRLFLRNASQVNRLLRKILPIFEKHNRRLIFRTWTVGAYLIGDLIWHRGRIASALEGIDSPAFIVSMKYGESDFFRYLPLNQHFFRVEQPKIIELQARREYEGAGEYPSFIGWECENFAKELRTATNMVGISVWCQTGGWHAFRRRAFLDKSAVWIDLNAEVVSRVFLKGQPVETAITEMFGEERAPTVLELLRRVDDVIFRLLYIEEFAQRKLFFRRVRIPPLLHVYWDCIFVNDSIRKILSHLISDHGSALRAGEAAFEQFERMEVLAEASDLPVEDILFMKDTFRLILIARRYYLLPPDPALEEQIRKLKSEYKLRWPRDATRQRYRIRTSFEPAALQGRTLVWVLRLLLRHQRGYRTLLDRLFTIHVLAWIYWIFRRRHEESLPKLARNTAMGVDTLFK